MSLRSQTCNVIVVVTISKHESYANPSLLSWQEVITLRGANQATVKDLGQLKTQRLGMKHSQKDTWKDRFNRVMWA